MKEAQALKKGIQRLTRTPSKKSLYTLPEQPWDSDLLKASALYRESRKNYLALPGKFHSRLTSSPRTLSSAILLRPEIEYSPLETEMIWSANQTQGADHLLAVRYYSVSVFHEQNHRILWKILPGAPDSQAGLRRYLNFAESLVIAADMALGDELSPLLSQVSYLSGLYMIPGSETGRKLRRKTREYRNYLQRALYSTYLFLELYDPAQVLRATQALFPENPFLAQKVVKRSGKLDIKFILNTNLFWRNKHAKLAQVLLSGKSALELPKDPLDNRLLYLWGEKWFDRLGI